VIDKRNQVVPVTEAHIIELSSTMQKSDREGAMALCNFSPEEAIRHSLASAFYSFTWLYDGKVIGIQGMSRYTLLSPFISVWMLGSEDLPLHTRTLLRGSKIWVEEALRRYGGLRNIVDSRATESIKWLRWLGFTICPAEPVGVNNHMFHIVKRRK
jgi:hypothetical protein